MHFLVKADIQNWVTNKAKKKHSILQTTIFLYICIDFGFSIIKTSTAYIIWRNAQYLQTKFFDDKSLFAVLPFFTTYYKNSKIHFSSHNFSTECNIFTQM